MLAVVVGPLAWTSAVAITWFNPVCGGFVACDAAGMGNNGYERVYTTSFWGMYPGHNCTNYAAYRLVARGINASYLAGQGMAYQWGSVAASHGVAVDKSPRVGDTAWFNQTAGLSTSGHVAYVESVDLAAGTVRLSEDNYKGDFDWRSYYIRDVTGFIHFGGAGTTPPPTPPPPPPAAPLADGTFVRVNETGEVDRIVGGAPVYVSSWAAFGGQRPVVAVSAAGLAKLPAYPRDSTLVSDNKNRVFRIAGGAPLLVSTWASLGGVQPTVTVDSAAIDNAGGAGAWSHLRSRPADGTFLTDATNGRVYIVAGGAPLYVTTWNTYGGMRASVAIDGWELLNYAHLSRVPAPVFLMAAPSRRYVHVVDGRPLPVTSWTPFGGVQPVVTIDDHALDACDHLLCDPFGHVDGVTPVPGGAFLTGWVTDPNTSSPLSMSIEADGVQVATFSSGGARPDVDAVFHAGTTAGFSGYAPLTSGSHNVCARVLGAGAGAASVVLGCSTVAVTAGSTVPVSPSRLLDTRTGFGTDGAGPRGAGSVTILKVTGRGSVPAAGISAVVLNVTVVAPTLAGHVTVYPTGQSRPASSNVNFQPGQTVPNLVLTPVAADGTVSIYNASPGGSQIIADVAGFVLSGTTTAPGATRSALATRMLDTRSGLGAARAGALAPGSVTTINIAGRQPVPTSGVGAVVLNVTVTSPTGAGFVTLYPSGQARPTASNLNFVSRQPVSNLVLVPVGPTGSVSLYNGSSGTVHVVIDVNGYTLAGVATSPGTTVAAAPARLLDTRVSLGASGAVAGGGTSTLKVTGRGTVPASGVKAVILNVTVTGPVAPGYLTVYPGGGARPNASNLNFGKAQTVPNLVLVPVGPDGTVSIFNGAPGSTHVLADIAGWVHS